MIHRTASYALPLALMAVLFCLPHIPAIEPKPRTIAESIAAGVDYLVKLQSPDGAWRSDVYGTFKDGPALTPLVVNALQSAENADVPNGEQRKQAIRKGIEYLAKMVKTDGTVDEGETGLDYPVYTAASAITALGHSGSKDLLPARDAWVRYLLARQLTEKLGWASQNKEFGGWGYCRVLPLKPDPNRFGPTLVESNLSATVTALDALRSAGIADQDVYKKALMFVGRCQNYHPPGVPPLADNRPNDGGFFFIYDDPIRNKAGSPDPPEVTATRFHSYGSTTADGTRALLRCGLKKDDPRVVAGRSWLNARFKPDSHPGTYVQAHERNREAVYFYYVASLSQTLHNLDDQAKLPLLSAALIARQKGDGSWANAVDLVRENDPIVATAKAIVTLANCTTLTP